MLQQPESLVLTHTSPTCCRWSTSTPLCRGSKGVPDVNLFSAESGWWQERSCEFNRFMLCMLRWLSTQRGRILIDILWTRPIMPALWSDTEPLIDLTVIPSYFDDGRKNLISKFQGSFQTSIWNSKSRPWIAKCHKLRPSLPLSPTAVYIYSPHLHSAKSWVLSHFHEHWFAKHQHVGHTVFPARVMHVCSARCAI